MKTIILPLVLLAWPLAPIVAQETGNLDDTFVETPTQPVIISDYQSSNAGTQIVIRSGEKEVYYEYRVNGQVMEIKVVPQVGPEYYLVPADGGWARESESGMLVPSWVLFRW